MGTQHKHDGDVKEITPWRDQPQADNGIGPRLYYDAPLPTSIGNLQMLLNFVGLITAAETMYLVASKRELEDSL